MYMAGLSKPKMPVAKFELPVAKYFYRLPPGGVLMVQILSTRGHLVRSLHTEIHTPKSYRQYPHS